MTSRFLIRIGQAISDLGCWLDRKGCAMVERARYHRRPAKPLRFPNEGETRLIDLSDMFRLMSAKAGIERMRQHTEDLMFASGKTWEMNQFNARDDASLDRRFAEIGLPLRASDYLTDKWDHWK